MSLESETADPEVEAFFGRLASRFRNENSLSDLTFTALESIPSFKTDFIRFFFPDLPVDGGIDLRREQVLSSESGRPDFVFRAATWNLIVENKIWDKNYHFAEYQGHKFQDGRTTHLALIANHAVPPQPGWSLKTWDDLVRHFDGRRYGSATSIFTGYLAYVRKLLRMSSYESFHFQTESLISLRHFSRMIEAVIQTAPESPFAISYLPEPMNVGESWSGHFLTVHFKEPSTKVALFLGVDYTDAPIHLTIALDGRLNPDLWDSLKDARELMEPGHFVRVRDNQERSLHFRMKEEDFHRLNEEPSKERQVELLQAFLTDTCRVLQAAVSAQKT